ncbi:cellulase family glycosylhydrolase [Alcanivoracaceae bacterium MT1]
MSPNKPKYLLFFLLVLIISAMSGCGGGGSSSSIASNDQAGPFWQDEGDNDEGESDDDTTVEGLDHSLSFDSDPRAVRIEQASKTFNAETDWVFRDGLGREVVMRGFNVSGKVKLAEFGFKPFKDSGDAAASLSALRQKTGANLVRFTVAWEGINPEPEELDYDYLDAIVEQIREAVSLGMYVVVDWHSDLFSRHVFTQSNSHTGNGAPGWIVNRGGHGTDGCGIPCAIGGWPAYKTSGPAVRSAMRSFWLNSPVQISDVEYRVQDVFVWQLGETAAYLKENLNNGEWNHILGFEPINEPFDGGMEELGLGRHEYERFDNEILWPFYEKVRAELDKRGIEEKWVFAEPMVFWHSNLDINVLDLDIIKFGVAPATGGGYLNYKPGNGFVFSPHFYDQSRMASATSDLVRYLIPSPDPKNGLYFKELDTVRDEARFLQSPVFLGEFGMPVDGSGNTDPERVINAIYQGMELSDRTSGKDRFVDFYVPVVSAGTQWQWDYYYDNHHEFLNGSPDKLITKEDAWNGENFSVIRDYARRYNLDARLIERVYPRRIQGDLMHFHYSAKVHDRAGVRLDWASLRLDLEGPFSDREYFRHQPFALAVWRGRNSDAPTEIFLPRDMSWDPLLVLTDQQIKDGTLGVTSRPANTANEIMLTHDADRAGGRRLLVWDDPDAGESESSIHFALLVIGAHNYSPDDLRDLQRALKTTLSQHRSPVYLTGPMSHGGYPDDKGVTVP